MFVSRIAAVLDRLHILAYDSCKHDRERLMFKDDGLAVFQQLSCTVLACRHQRLFIYPALQRIRSWKFLLSCKIITFEYINLIS